MAQAETPREGSAHASRWKVRPWMGASRKTEEDQGVGQRQPGPRMGSQPAATVQRSKIHLRPQGQKVVAQESREASRVKWPEGRAPHGAPHGGGGMGTWEGALQSTSPRGKAPRGRNCPLQGPLLPPPAASDFSMLCPSSVIYNKIISNSSIHS